MTNAYGSGQGPYQYEVPTIGKGPPLTLEPPAGAALIQRYDDGSRWIRLSPDTLSQGLPPRRIPRLWNPSLGALAGLVQYGWQDAYSALRLSPVVIVPPTRNGPSAVQAQWDGQPANTLGVPALFIQ